MPHTTGVAVVATQLAETDRRALSQAWYSALHVAEHMPSARPPAPAPPRTACRGAGGTRGAFGAVQHGSAGDTRGARAARDATPRRPDESGALERRATKSERARRVERRPAGRQERRPAPSFVVPGAGGRVQVVVRSDGGRTRILAVCAMPLREPVERALAHARVALASSG